MPTYCHVCHACGRRWESVRPVSESRVPQPCGVCGTPGARDYQSEAKQVGMIDGHHSGYYSSALRDKDGKPFPRDPKRPRKRIVPNNLAFKDAIKRTEGLREETG